MAKRNTAFDTIKAFAIFLVVYVHYVLIPNESFIGNVMMALASAGVPLFLMVSGALMHSSKSFDYKKYANKLVKIYVVMLVWKVIHFLYYVIPTGATFGMGELIRYFLLLDNSLPIPSQPMWYMNAFLMALLLYPISYYLLNHDEATEKIYKHLLALTFVSGFGITFLYYALSMLGRLFSFTPFDAGSLYAALPFRQYANTLFFFLLGGYVFKYNDKIREKLQEKMLFKAIPFIMVAVGLGGLLIMKYSLSGAWLWDGIGIEQGYERLSTILLVLGCWLIFMNYENKVTIAIGQHIGKYTMGIFYTHYMLLYAAAVLLYPRIPTVYTGMNLLKTILTLAICLGVTRIGLKIPVVKNLFQ